MSLENLSMFASLLGRGPRSVHDMLDRDCGWPTGTSAKMSAQSSLYERQIRLTKIMQPNATRAELRHTIMPMIVERVYKDWSPPKQEFLVREGVRIWFEARPSWEGFHESCQKWVHKQGFKSGPGDRALFGATVEEADEWAGKGKASQRVYWSEDEEERPAKRGTKSRRRNKKGKNKKEKSTAGRATAKPQAADSGDEEEKPGDEGAGSQMQQVGRMTRSATKREREAVSQTEQEQAEDDDVEPKAKKARASATQSATKRRTAAGSRRVAKSAKISKT